MLHACVKNSMWRRILKNSAKYFATKQGHSIYPFACRIPDTICLIHGKWWVILIQAQWKAGITTWRSFPRLLTCMGLEVACNLMADRRGFIRDTSGLLDHAHGHLWSVQRQMHALASHGYGSHFFDRRTVSVHLFISNSHISFTIAC
jgi:hypothetical protein